MSAHSLLTFFGLGFAAILGSLPGFLLGWLARGWLAGGRRR